MSTSPKWETLVAFVRERDAARGHQPPRPEAAKPDPDPEPQPAPPAQMRLL